MNRRAALTLTAVLVLGAFTPSPVRAGPDTKKEASTARVNWLHDLTKAFERSAADDKVLMICINARNPIGERDEPAAKGLREVVYQNAAFVKRSSEFVCVLVTAEGSSADYGELRLRLGIDGLIVSPQHIFVHPRHVDGTKPLFREQYWRYGCGPEAAKMLMAMMDKALAAYRVKKGMPDGPGEGATQSTEQRAAWIQKLIALARGQDAALRKQALREISRADQEGDCITPLIPLVKELDEAGEPGALADVIRTRGVPELAAALPALHDLLKHKEPGVRGNTAVTLEYIGLAASVEPLLARAKREKDEKIRNHLYRAAGRCGAGVAAVRKKLLRASVPGKDGDFGCFGPVIGLAYFVGDAKAARSLEKQLLKLGSPLQQGSKAHSFLRSGIVWTLSEIRDPKTAAFLRKKVIAPLAEEKSPWKDWILRYYEAVARICAGDDDAQAVVTSGIEGAIWTDNARELVDEFRRGRDMSKFTPKGEWGNEPKDD